MELSEFIEATNRAEKYYEKEYSTEQQKIMFEEVKKMPLEKYQKAIGICIRSCKYLPKLVEILNAANSIIDMNNNNKKIQVPCSICRGSGIVRYYKILQENGYEYEYACKCTCKNGENYSKKIPTFEDLGIQPGEKTVMQFE